MRFALICVVGLALAGRVGAAQEHEHGGGAAGGLGTVHFATSCTPPAQRQFDRAVALLHSFEFGPAIEAFTGTAAADPACGLSQWGIALARWGNPFGIGLRPPAQIARGLEAVSRGRTMGLATDRERAYLDAAARLYENADRVPQAARVAAYRDAMAAVAHAYPDDSEASIFYALSLTAAEDPSDKTYGGRLQAAAILERLFEQQPNHPGLAHYLIHSYDVPALAPRALDAARRYAKIAPAAPHALHMPSHTFTRLGLWKESTDANIASAAAARRVGATSEELHATDYEVYAYLQTAQDAAAKRLVDAVPDLLARFDPAATVSAAPPAGALYAAAAIPARWALERGAWAEAAALDVHPSGLPYADALTAFARALGAARSGDIARAREATGTLERLRDAESQANEPYWTGQIDIARRVAASWIAFAEGRRPEAIDALHAAADAEDGTEKAAITPGPLAPAREQLGEMLLASGDAPGALQQFQRTLEREPNRFRALYGAAQSARRAGDRATAMRYFTQLTTLCREAGDPARPELQEAKRFSAGGDSR